MKGEIVLNDGQYKIIILKQMAFLESGPSSRAIG